MPFQSSLLQDSHLIAGTSLYGGNFNVASSKRARKDAISRQQFNLNIIIFFCPKPPKINPHIPFIFLITPRAFSFHLFSLQDAGVGESFCWGGFILYPLMIFMTFLLLAAVGCWTGGRFWRLIGWMDGWMDGCVSLWGWGLDGYWSLLPTTRHGWRCKICLSGNELDIVWVM
jgi:hypothetical protein